MQKRATYSGGYSLIFAAVALVVGATAVVRRDGLVTMAVAIFGLYILHLLSLRSLARSQAKAPTRPSRTARTQQQVSAPRGSAWASRPDEPGRSSAEPEGQDGPVFLSPKSGFVREVGESSIPKHQQPTTEDSEWMVKVDTTKDEPEFLPVDGDDARQSFSADGDDARQSFSADGDDAGQSFSADRASSSDLTIPRKFALGTVAIIRRALDPAQVARILEEQRKFPKKRFGEIAVELEYITEPQLDELLAAQKAGLFKEDDIQSARARLEAFRREASSAAV